MSEIVIRAMQLGKTYQIFAKPQDRLKQMLLGPTARLHRDFVALHDASFEVRRGEALGIIGRNGHGKSTLLQILAGTIKPSAGTVEVTGRTAALLEIGAGFDPEFSGRENVFFSGMLQGLARAEVRARLPEILAFADIGDYIDQPVKTYSTGMFVRLAFAAQVFQEPDVFIVDEALAVGDVFFQQKCFEKIRELQRRGMTLVFVSHDMAAVRNVCDRAILLRSGAIVYDGPPEEAVSRYYDVPLEAPRPLRDTLPGTQETRVGVAPEIRAALLSRSLLPRAVVGHGAGGLQVAAVTFENEAGEPNLMTAMEATARIGVLLRATHDVADPSVGIHLFDRMNNLVFAAGSRQRRLRLPDLRAGDELAVELDLTLNVQPGEYTFSIGCSAPSSEGPNVGINLDRHEGLGPIVVHADPSALWPFYGIAALPLTVRVLPQGST